MNKKDTGFTFGILADIIGEQKRKAELRRRQQDTMEIAEQMQVRMEDLLRLFGHIYNTDELLLEALAAHSFAQSIDVENIVDGTIIPFETEHFPVLRHSDFDWQHKRRATDFMWLVQRGHLSGFRLTEEKRAGLVFGRSIRAVSSIRDYPNEVGGGKVIFHVGYDNGIENWHGEGASENAITMLDSLLLTMETHYKQW